MNPNDPNNNPTPAPDQNPNPQSQPEIPPVQPTPQPYSAVNPASAGVAPMQPTVDNPGKGLGIASLITSLLGLGLVGLILGLIGLNKSKKAGMSNGLALAGTIIGAVGMVVGLLFFIVAYNGVSEVANELVSACENSTSGVVSLSDGSEYTCPQ